MDLFEHILEERGYRITRGVRVISAVQELPRTLEGNTEYLDQHKAFQIQVSEDSYGRIEREESRGVFTLGHEVGHLALHQSELRRLKQLPERMLMLARESRNHPIYKDSEWQANMFSAAFIMPAPALQYLQNYGRLDADTVCRRFGMSYEAAECRLRTFNHARGRLLRAWQRARSR